MTDNSKAIAALKAVISGRVQGVYFRVFVERQATNLQLCGYVQNRRDLSVEVYAEGPREKLEQLIECMRKGPPGARVENIDINWSENQGKYHNFNIIP